MAVDGSSAAGGIVNAFSEDHSAHAVMHAGIDSGCVSVSGSAGSASMSVFQDGGGLAINGKDEKIRFVD